MSSGLPPSRRGKKNRSANGAEELVKLAMCDKILFISELSVMNDKMRADARRAAREVMAHIRTGIGNPEASFPWLAGAMDLLQSMDKLEGTNDGRLYTNAFNGSIGLPHKIIAAANALSLHGE